MNTTVYFMAYRISSTKHGHTLFRASVDPRVAINQGIAAIMKETGVSEEDIVFTAFNKV